MRPVPSEHAAQLAGQVTHRGFDRIVSMTSVRPIPASWLAALRPGGRLVTVIARTALIITADKTSGDWAAVGRDEWDRAMFMAARTSAAPPPLRDDAWPGPDSGNVGPGRYPVVDVAASWELVSADGSWATATATKADDQPTVRQGGPHAGGPPSGSRPGYDLMLPAQSERARRAAC